jgi:hypothetical protein
LTRSVVIAGLDPAIHLMDARVKPAHDDSFPHWKPLW